MTCSGREIAEGAGDGGGDVAASCRSWAASAGGGGSRAETHVFTPLTGGHTLRLVRIFLQLHCTVCLMRTISFNKHNKTNAKMI